MREAHAVLLENLIQFEDNHGKREQVIEWSMEKSGLTHDRLDRYYGEVFNRLNQHHLDGLFRFLSQACGMAENPRFAYGGWLTPLYEISNGWFLKGTQVDESWLNFH